MEEALHLYKTMFGRKNLWNADIFQSIANLRGCRMEYDKACILLEETTRIRIDLLGPEHESTGKALFNLGIVFDKKQEYDATKKVFIDYITIRYKSYGPNRIEYAETLLAFGVSLANQNDLKNALEVFEEANLFIITSMKTTLF